MAPTARPPGSLACADSVFDREGLGIGEDGSYEEALLREHLLQKRRRYVP
jgi:hypothetical protein